MYGMTSQIRRSAVSIPSNIAEGCCRGSEMDFKRYLQIAVGSASELEYQVYLAKDLQYTDNSNYEILKVRIIEVKRILSSLINKLKADS